MHDNLQNPRNIVLGQEGDKSQNLVDIQSLKFNHYNKNLNPWEMQFLARVVDDMMEFWERNSFAKPRRMVLWAAELGIGAR